MRKSAIVLILSILLTSLSAGASSADYTVDSLLAKYETFTTSHWDVSPHRFRTLAGEFLDSVNGSTIEFRVRIKADRIQYFDHESDETPADASFSIGSAGINSLDEQKEYVGIKDFKGEKGEYKIITGEKTYYLFGTLHLYIFGKSDRFANEVKDEDLVDVKGLIKSFTHPGNAAMFLRVEMTDFSVVPVSVGLTTGHELHVLGGKGTKIGITVQPPIVAVDSLRKPLRSEFKALTKDEVMGMVKRTGFYDGDWMASKRWTNNFEEKTTGGDKVILDRSTSLEWHPGGSEEHMNYPEALKWLADLNEKGYAGHKDWRLPTVEELASILPNRPFVANNYWHIFPQFEPLTELWTGDQVKGYRSGGEEFEAYWVVEFFKGDYRPGAAKGFPPGQYQVKPVRMGATLRIKAFS